MTDEDKLRLEVARTAVLKAAIYWRKVAGDGVYLTDKAEMKLCEAVDHYEDLVYAIEHKEPLTDSDRNTASV
jgi:hypothetical protein